VHPVGDESDEGGGLARARGAEHGGGCTRGEVEHGALRRVEHREPRGPGRRGDGGGGRGDLGIRRVGHDPTVGAASDIPSAPVPLTADRRFRALAVSYARPVDIRIGIINTAREIGFETDQSAADIERTVAAALDAKSAFFTLKDDKGKLYIVPTSNLAYVEVGSDTSRRVGFVA